MAVSPVRIVGPGIAAPFTSPQRQTRNGWSTFLRLSSPASTNVAPILPLDLGVHEIGDEDPASWRLAFKARCYVHAVAKDVGALDDDFAQVDADAELDARPLLDRRVVIRHCALDRDGTGDSVHRAAKFDQRAIAHGLDDAPAVLGHRRIEDFRPDQVEVQEGARLILAHEPGVANDIGGEYRGKSARQVLVRGQRSLTMAGRSGRETSNRTVLPPTHSIKPTVP